MPQEKDEDRSRNNLAEITERARSRLLRLHHEAQSGHLGGNLSCLEALIALHHALMRPDDRFILSKGHSAAALYVTLWSQGLLDEKVLQSFGQDGSPLPGHPSGDKIPGLQFPTGSLGHGPSLAAGLALAARLQRTGRHIWCLCSDGEWQEGSCWEALVFAVHHKLDNLSLLIDQNGLQGFGSTAEVASISDLTPRFSAFGAFASLVDGHDQPAIIAAAAERRAKVPRILVLQTIKGRGTGRAGTVASHYLPPSDEEYRRLMDEAPGDKP